MEDSQETQIVLLVSCKRRLSRIGPGLKTVIAPAGGAAQVAGVFPADHQPVLLYDGECGLCNRLVRVMLRTDRKGRLKFAALQSRPAQAYLRAQGLPTEDFDSLVFVPDWNTRQPGAYQLRTAGALAAAAEIGGGWRVVSWMRILPAWLRDPFYRFIARTRYALFGQYRPTPLERPEWAERFLSD